MEIAKAQIEKIMKKHSGMRVSVDAVKEMTDFVEELAMELGSTAVDLAATAKRKTVTEEDLKLAVKRM